MNKFTKEMAQIFPGNGSNLPRKWVRKSRKRVMGSREDAFVLDNVPVGAKMAQIFPFKTRPKNGLKVGNLKK